MTDHSIDRLSEIASDNQLHESMRLAAIWELQNRNVHHSIPEGMELQLEQTLQKKI